MNAATIDERLAFITNPFLWDASVCPWETGVSGAGKIWVRLPTGSGERAPYSVCRNRGRDGL